MKRHDISTINFEIGARPQAACGSTLTFATNLKTWHQLLLGLSALSFAGCDQLPVTAPPGDYDLEATSVTFTPKEVFVGDPVVFSKVISNLGKDSIPARSYEVDLYVEKDRVSFDHATSMIIAGGNTSYGMAPGYHHWKPTKPGTYTYLFVVDERKRLVETNEANNQITGVIIVKTRPKDVQDGADQPATATESERDSKPKPESKERSQ